MKKICSLLISILLIFLMSGPVFATSDTTPPVINSISINARSLSGGEKLLFKISGDDDLSGIYSIMIEYHLKSDHKQKLSIEFDNQSSSNIFSGTYKIPEKTSPGEWEVFAIQVWDNAGNRQLYVAPDLHDLGNMDFTVKKKQGADITPPILESIIIKNKVISAPGKIEVTAVAIDDKSSNVKVQVTYLIADEQHAISLSKTTGNTYTGSLNVGEKAKYQPVKLGFVLLEDDAGNQTWYSYDPSEYPFGDQSLKLNTNIDVSFSNAVSDTIPPELLNYNYSNSEVAAPGTVNIEFNARDDISGVASISAHFIGVDSEGRQISYFILSPQYSSKSKKFVSKHTFDQYYPNCVFSIIKIEIKDMAGNLKIYSTEPQAGESKLKEKTLTLTRAIVGDVAAGTMNDNYAEKIRDAGDNDVITLDCTANPTASKGVFDAIRGSNKTLILVNDGIQWIFKGSDIFNTAKDINTRIKISKLDDLGNEHMLDCFTESNNGLVIEFASNGLLPGRALIKIKADYTFRNYVGESDLYVYLFQDAEGSLEAIAERIEMNAGGYFEFYITHNSKYIISSNKAKAEAITKDSTSLNEELSVSIAQNDDFVLREEQTVAAKNDLTDESDTQLYNNNNNYYYIYSLVFIMVLAAIAVVFRIPIMSKLKGNRNSHRDQ